MNEWTLHTRYKGRSFQVKALLEYHSNQVMRIRLFGSSASLLLENNYPVTRNSRGRKGVHWKIREGELKQNNPDTAKFLVDIFGQLEEILKTDFPPDVNG